MKLITREFDEMICIQEKNKNDIMSARSILEIVLSNQFQLLSLGLFSFEILRGKNIESIEYDILKDICNSLYPQDSKKIESLGLIAYITEGIINKKWKVIKLIDLYNIEIRIYNKSVYLWNDIEINEQLSILGSNYRLYFAGANDISIAHIKRLVKFDDVSSFLDGRFIFGEIGNISVSYWGPVYDFKNETAVSPYFDNYAPGFSVGDTVVIREKLINTKEALTSEDVPNADLLHIFIHETLHTMSYSYKDEMPFAKANWTKYTERDICRYLCDEHNYTEIKNAFSLNFESPIVEKLLNDPDKKKVMNEFNNLELILNSLLDSGKIILTKNENYKCISYEKGKSWDLL